MEIRPLRGADYPAAERLVDAVDEREAGRLDPVFFHHLGGYAAEDGADGLIGFLLGFRSDQDPDVAFVHLVAVHPDHRKSRVASDLYRRFERQARTWDAVWLEAVVEEGNERAMAFHRKLGFSPPPQSQPEQWRTHGRPVVRLRKRVTYDV